MLIIVFISASTAML